MELDLVSQKTIPAYAALADLLAAVKPLPSYEDLGVKLVSPSEMPAQARSLLEHEEHMTLRLAAAHGTPLALRVLAERRKDGEYCREILLLRADTGIAVEFGIVRIIENSLPARMIDEIVRRERPLGDILVGADILRRIEPRWYYRFSAASQAARALGCPLAFGRVGVIHCNGRPAIDVFEAIPINE